MEASFFRGGKEIKHPLEEKLSASAWAILSAIERSRMAVMNVKGQLAEYYLNLHLESLLANKRLQEVEWRIDSPDFSVKWNEKPFSIECKNMRNKDKKVSGKVSCWVEIQRTRDSKEGKGTRAYKKTDFDVLAVCLFNRTGRWEYRFIASKKLAVRKTDAALLEITQVVADPAAPPWYDDVTKALAEV